MLKTDKVSNDEFRVCTRSPRRGRDQTSDDLKHSGSGFSTLDFMLTKRADIPHIVM